MTSYSQCSTIQHVDDGWKLLHFREKRKEKEREELWKSLEQLEIDHNMKLNFTPNATHDNNTTTEPQENAAPKPKDDSAC
jgi:hypothetical protein